MEEEEEEEEVSPFVNLYFQLYPRTTSNPCKTTLPLLWCPYTLPPFPKAPDHGGCMLLDVIKIYFSSVLRFSEKLSTIKMHLTIAGILLVTFISALTVSFSFIWEAVIRLMTHLIMRVTWGPENTARCNWASINEPAVWTPRQHNNLVFSPLCSSDKDITIARNYDLSPSTGTLTHSWPWMLQQNAARYGAERGPGSLLLPWLCAGMRENKKKW